MRRPAKSSSGGGRIRQALRYLGLATASLDPRRRVSPPRAATLAYSECELLRRDEELNRAAEQQWQTIAAERRVGFDLFVEGWPNRRAPHRLEARLELLAPAPPERLPPATTVSVRLRATNTGDTRWLTGSPTERGAVCLGVQLRDAAGGMLARDHYRVPRPRAVDPGETVEIDATVPGPPESRRFRLVFDLVTEQICGSSTTARPASTSRRKPEGAR